MFFSGDLDLGPLGSYSGSPFLTPDAFLRSPDKDALGRFLVVVFCLAPPLLLICDLVLNNFSFNIIIIKLEF